MTWSSESATESIFDIDAIDLDIGQYELILQSYDVNYDEKLALKTDTVSISVIKAQSVEVKQYPQSVEVKQCPQPAPRFEKVLSMKRLTTGKKSKFVLPSIDESFFLVENILVRIPP